jgi:hypothetical protein
VSGQTWQDTITLLGRFGVIPATVTTVIISSIPWTGRLLYVPSLKPRSMFGEGTIG